MVLHLGAVHPSFLHLVASLGRLGLLAAQQYHLSFRDLLVLGLLAIRGPTSFTELHRLLAIPKSALTGAVDRLYARGVVERQHDQRDRRRWFVSLTPEGVRLTTSLDRQEGLELTKAWQDLYFSEPDRLVLLRAVQQLGHELARPQPGGTKVTTRGATMARSRRRKEV